MKKVFALILTLCMILSVGTLLTSCEHEHEFEEKWSSDATHHWHVCKDESCKEKKDSAAHDWAQQEIYAENGDLVFDCTVCGARKTEPKTLTQAEWEAAFNATMSATNATWDHQQNDGTVLTNRIDGNKAFVSNSHPYNGTKDCYYLIESSDVIWHYYTPEQADVWTREQVIGSDHHLTELEAVLNPFKAQFSQFTRNADTGIYEAASMELLTYTFTDVKVGIENGYVTYFTYTLQLAGQSATVALTFSDYGTTSVTLPTVAQ